VSLSSSQTVTINELKQKVVDLHTEANGMKTQTEKYQTETTELKEKYSKETAELHSQVQTLTLELSEKTKLVETQQEQLVDFLPLQIFLMDIRLRYQPTSLKKVKLLLNSGTPLLLSPPSFLTFLLLPVIVSWA
jgi:predicted RNase H-like nuclease (RuvC/YqgF family)